jgi:hypothetical protein
MRKSNGERKGRVKRHCPFEGHFALAPARTHDINQRKWRTPTRGNSMAWAAARTRGNHVFPRSGLPADRAALIVRFFGRHQRPRFRIERYGARSERRRRG